MTVKQRGRNDLTFKFVYNTPGYTATFISQPTPTNPRAGTWEYSSNGGGFGLSTPYNWSLSSPGTTETCNGQSQITVYKAFVVHDPDGGQHPLPISRGNAGVTTACGELDAGPALDGSGIWASATGPVTGTIYLKDGTVINQTGTPPVQLEDSNGNLESLTSDTLGRNLLTVTDSSTTTTYTSPLGKTTTGASFTQWIIKDSNGVPQQFQLTYQLIDTEGFTQSRGLGVQAHLTAGTALVPLTLTLPNQTTYQFAFYENNFGELQQITLPTEASISYTYGGTSPGLGCTSPPNSVPNASLDCRVDIASRTVTSNGSSATWTYNGGLVTDPLGNDEVHTWNFVTSGNMMSSNGTVEKEVQYYNGCSPLNSSCTTPGMLLRTVATSYAGDPYGLTLVNLRPISVTTTLDNGLISQTQTDYETFTGSTNISYGATTLNPTAKREYGYGTSVSNLPLLRQTKYTYLHTGNSNYISRNIVDRVLSKRVLDGIGNQVALTNYEYDNYGHANQPMVASSAVQHDSNYGTGFLYRGNVTAVSRWLSPSNSFLTTTNQYDDAGNVLSTIDPLGNKTSFDFTDSWSDATCAPSGAGKAYATKITNPLGQFTTRKFNSCTASLASVTDPNTQPTSYSYDSLDRPTQVSYPDGGKTTHTYDDTNLIVTTGALTTSTTSAFSRANYDQLGRLSQSQLCEDGTSSCATSIKTDTTYDLLSRVVTVSNPYRAISESTYGLTQNQYDGLGRETLQIPTDGTATTNNEATAYSGNCTAVTDEAGNSRKSCSDGLGRLTQVIEDPGSSPHLNYETDYSYDTLDNLTCVEQHGNATGTGCSSAPSNDASSLWRVRRFTYDSLSRLLSATNQESGPISYTYDADGNVKTKTARSPNQSSVGTAQVTTTYTYDALNRLTGKSYTDAVTTNPKTSPVQYGYDGVAPTGCTPPTVVSPARSGLPTTPTNVIGRRSSICDGSGATAWIYDAMGRPTMEERALNGVTKNIAYVYYLGGQPKNMYYPSGDFMSFDVDAAGRTNGEIDPSNNYVAGNARFAPNGALASIGQYSRSGSTTVGQTTWLFYNKRFQPALEYAGYVNSSNTNTYLYQRCYDFHQGGGLNITAGGFTCSSSTTSPGNNGNVYQIGNKLDDTRTQNFVYDSLNRITQGYSNGNNWGQAFTIDPWGNMTNVAAVGTKTLPGGLSAAPATLKNQLTGYNYDAAGNLLSDGLGHSFTYDAENRVITTSGVTYTYDGDGQRVEKCAAGTPGTCATGATGTLYWTGMGSEALSESDLSGNISAEYVYFNGTRVSRVDRPSMNVHAFLSDHLGSSRMMVTPSAASTLKVEEDLDYTPYGIEVGTATPTDHYEFTGKERDSESGMDNFGARYYASLQGRLMTPDWAAEPTAVPYAMFGDPQSLNLYAFTRNNPLNRIDPDGHRLICKTSTSTDKSGRIRATVSCHEKPDMLPPPIIFGLAVGHHFVDQALIRAKAAWNTYAGRLFRGWTTGPLQNPGDHVGYSGPHRANSTEIKQIVERVEQETGRGMAQWNRDDIEKAVGEIRQAAGDKGDGAVKDFLSKLAGENPGARTVQDPIEARADEAAMVRCGCDSPEVMTEIPTREPEAFDDEIPF